MIVLLIFVKEKKQGIAQVAGVWTHHHKTKHHVFFSKGRFQPNQVQENIQAPYAEHTLRALDGFCHLLSLT